MNCGGIKFRQLLFYYLSRKPGSGTRNLKNDNIYKHSTFIDIIFSSNSYHHLSIIST